MAHTRTVISEADAIEMFDELLNESGVIEVAGCEFTPSRILKSLDPIAYRVTFSDYTSSLEEDYEIEG